MGQTPYSPIFQLTRGDTVESIHYGSVAVSDATGRLVAWYGDPETITFLRSSAKPFQLLPFITHGGQSYFHLTPREVALMAASHSGTDEHVAVIEGIQQKTGVSESELMCGVHPPGDAATLEALRERNEEPTPNRHNCSGKHTGMLAYVHMRQGVELPSGAEMDYIDPSHPIQKEILETFAEMCALPATQVHLGTDGCSAPNFAVPLKNAATGFARLCDPVTGNVQPPERLAACQVIVSSMMFNPDMVAGPGRFDTRLMEVGQGRIVSKGGAEGYQAIGLLPDALGPGSPALGIAFKISDGDPKGRARPAVALEILRELGALSPTQLDMLADFGPDFPVENWREIKVGWASPCFNLQRNP